MTVVSVRVLVLHHLEVFSPNFPYLDAVCEQRPVNNEKKMLADATSP